jgi:selT/selW/selH-like putative selenoprotein
VKPKLIKGSGGVFDVVADGKTVFSKHQVGRFPDEKEIIKILQR